MSETYQPFLGKHPVAFLYEKMPDIEFEFVYEKRGVFIVQVVLGNKVFAAKGTSKKQAKVNVAEKVLNEICSRDIINPIETATQQEEEDSSDGEFDAIFNNDDDDAMAGVSTSSTTAASSQEQKTTKETQEKKMDEEEAAMTIRVPCRGDQGLDYVTRNPVSLLNELRPNINFADKGQVSGNNFVFTCEVYGQTFTGIGFNKKEAKGKCAEEALRSLYKNAFEDPPENLNIARQEYNNWTVHSPWEYVAIEGDFTGCEPGVIGGAGRCVIVNYDGDVIMDLFIKSDLPLPEDFKPRNAIKKYDVEHGVTISIARNVINKLKENNMLIGYNLNKLLAMLGVTHPDEKMYDTALDSTLIKLAIRHNNGQMGFRSLCKTLVGRKISPKNIRASNTVSGAKAIMELFKLSLYIDYCVAMEEPTATNLQCTMLKRKVHPDSVETGSVAVPVKKAKVGGAKNKKSVKNKPIQPQAYFVQATHVTPPVGSAYTTQTTPGVTVGSGYTTQVTPGVGVGSGYATQVTPGVAVGSGYSKQVTQPIAAATNVNTTAYILHDRYNRK